MVGNIGNSHGCSIPARSPFTLSPALRPWGGHGAGTSQEICQIPQLSGDKHRDDETDPYSLSGSPVIRGVTSVLVCPHRAGVVAGSRCPTQPGREEQGRRSSGRKAAPTHGETPSGCRCLRPHSAFNRAFPKSPSQEDVMGEVSLPGLSLSACLSGSPRRSSAGRQQSSRALLEDAAFRARPHLCSPAPLPALREPGQRRAEQGEKLGSVQGQRAAAEEPGLEARAAWLWAGGSCARPFQLCWQLREGKSAFCACL